MNVGFMRIFWGLLFVALDIRFSSVDFILPDFIGYILIVSGLSQLVQHHQWFRIARVLAVILIFVSLTSLVEAGMDSRQAPRLKREWISTLTGELSTLLPRQVNSARLTRVTSSAADLDKNRSHNPQRDADRILGEYSDGTTVLILRYGSSDQVLQAMADKTETDYSGQAIRQKAEADETYRAQTISFPHGSSSSGETKISEYSNVQVADREIQQWWNRGWIWWNPATWGSDGGWSSRLLYIVEGYSNSAENFKSALGGQTFKGSWITIDPLFPISAVANILDILLIWAICSGIIALAIASNNFELMQVARIRRNFYFVLAVPAFCISIIAFIAPEAVLGAIESAAVALLLIYVVLAVVSVLLVMGLVRKAANAVK